MSRKALIAEIILIGFIMLYGAFVCVILGVIGKLIAIDIVGVTFTL